MGFNANSHVNCKASQPAWPAYVTLLQGAEMVNPERMNTSINKRGLFIEAKGWHSAVKRKFFGSFAKVFVSAKYPFKISFAWRWTGWDHPPPTLASIGK